MDKIWYRNISKSEVIGSCGGMKKMNDHIELTRVELKNKRNELHTLVSGQYLLAIQDGVGV